MSKVSELYEAEYTITDYETLSYNWGNSEHPSTYQSFATRGQGTIDQTIVPFQRMKDAWSLGAYSTTITAGASYLTPTLTIRQNKLSKNNVVVQSDILSPPTGTTLAYTSTYYLNSCVYSPQTPTLGGGRPWINFSYNKFIVIPTFGMQDPTTGQRPSQYLTYNEVVAAGYQNWRVTHIMLHLYNSPGNWYINPACVQYAGELPIVDKERVNYGYKLIITGYQTSVLYIPLGLQLFNAYGSNPSQIHGNPDGCTNTVFFKLDEMDFDMSPWQTSRIATISFEDAEKIMNRLGFTWGKSVSAASSARGIRCTDPDVVCPVIDSDTHMVTDTVLSGSEIAEYALQHIDDEYCNFLLDYGNVDENNNPIGITTDDYRENYEQRQSTTEEVDEIDLNEPVVATSGGNSVWLMDEDKLKEFFTFLWDPDGNRFNDIVKAVALCGENPMDSVVSCRFFPLDLNNFFDDHFETQTRYIMFGRYQTEVNARLLISSNVTTYDLGSFYFNDADMFNDFRDYEPYSQYAIYIPFIGVVQVSAIECINTTISIKLIIDLITGACTAVIFTNGVPYKYLDGMIGIEIPVTGRNMAQYGQQILGAALGGLGAGMAVGGKSGAFNAASSISSQSTGSNLSAMGNNIANMSYGGSSSYGMAMGGRALAHGTAALASAALPMASMGAFALGGALVGGAAAALLNSPSPQSAGSNVPAMGLAKPLYPYFIVQRSDSWIPDNYAKLYGRFCQKGGKIGDFHGFSTFGNVNVSGITNATNHEKIMITELLTKGVIL
ncbi:MAG: hypothetical protein IJH65_13285 [Methanobrevibacter sp.]|nr:hypothetical protein [Methanobrevibacter sp.]